MRTLYASAIVAAVSLMMSPAHGQLSFGGRPVGLDRSVGLPPMNVVEMPAVDVDALKAEDALRAEQGIKGPWRFGFNHHVDLGMENSGVWHTLSNGDRVWRLAVRCPGAISVNFEFHDYVIPEGAQVFVYNELDEYLGAFEAGSNPGETQMGVSPLVGDLITIEYVEPLAVRGQGRLRVGQVTHAYRDIVGASKGLNDSGDCNINVVCPLGDEYRDQIRSVAMIIANGDGACTGQLINNCNNDGTPYFLTANHCLGGSNWVFRFNWDSPTCSNTTNGPMNYSVAGFTLLENSSTSDVALLRLNTNPPPIYNVFYTGWDKSSSPATGVTAIHHPSGDIKKISKENQAVSAVNYGGASCWRISGWDEGTTEGGSSGSGLWNEDGLLVGQLYGGQASCDFNFNDNYGRFNVSYPLLDEWLGTCGNTLQGTNLPTAIAERAATGVLQVLPNPTTGAVSVLVPSTFRGSRVRITDALGRVVQENNLTGGLERVQLDLSKERDGLYLVEVTAGTSRLVERIVLAR